MAEIFCPRDDGGRLVPIMGSPSNPRPGQPAYARVLSGYRCTKGHTLSVSEVEAQETPEK